MSQDRNERVNKWRREHPERVKEYHKKYLRRKYLKDFLREVVGNDAGKGRSQSFEIQ